MQNIKTRFIVNTIFFFLVYALMCYVVVRALTIVMTHDEAYSFYNVKHFWYVETLCTGNTHWFNFLAIKTAVVLGLEKTSQLRWFSLLSAGVYLTLAYFWIKSLKDIPTKILAFTIALLNPFLIDYLSLARGYSAGLMFEVMAICCYVLYLKNTNHKLAFISLFFAGMSAIANFNFFYFFVAFGLVYFYNTYKTNSLGLFKNKQFYVELLFSLGIVALVIRALRFMTLCSNDIGDYGSDNLIDGLFVGFIDSFIYRKFNVSNGIIQMLSYALCVFMIGAALFGVFKTKKQHYPWYRLASILFLLMIGTTVFNRWCFGVLYPTYRTTLMFYPLVTLISVGFVSTVITAKKIKAVIPYIVSLPICIHFITTLNLHTTFDYYQQADTKTCFTFLDSLKAKKVGIAPELYGVFRNYYQMTDHYKFKFEGESINTSIPNGVDAEINKLKDFDYVVLFPPYNLSFYKNNQVHLKGIMYYKNTGTLIMRVDK